MIKLICTKCGRGWYTANTMPGQKCDVCGGELIEFHEQENTNDSEKNTDINKKG